VSDATCIRLFPKSQRVADEPQATQDGEDARRSLGLRSGGSIVLIGGARAEPVKAIAKHPPPDKLTASYAHGQLIMGDQA